MKDELLTLAKRVDWLLIAAATALSLIGVAFIDSAKATGDSLATATVRQMIYLVVALIALGLLAWFDYRKLAAWAWGLWGVGIVLLVAVLFVGVEIGGAISWIRLGPISIQPSEFAKVATVLLTGVLVGKRQAGRLRFGDTLVHCLAVGIPMLLTLKQNDTGTAGSFFPLLCAAVFVSGLRTKWVIVAVLVAAALTPVAWKFAPQHQKGRFLVLQDPEYDPQGIGWQLRQSLIAVGGGGPFGQGYKKGAQNRLGYLPERHTDYIFAIVGEEWGFAGTTLVLGLYALLLSRIGRAAMLARDRLGAMICIGTFLFLAAHLAVNVGMVVGLVPTIGIPLLLLSYGGSALVATFAMLGMTLSVGVQRHAR
jgi:rod shape determining protein RodA